MTDGQKKLVNWIQSKTGVRYNPKDNLQEYIREWRPKAEDIAAEERMMSREDFCSPELRDLIKTEKRKE